MNQQPLKIWQTTVNGQGDQPMKKLTKEQRDNILFAIRWMGGDKLYRVVHVKGDAWKAVKP